MIKKYFMRANSASGEVNLTSDNLNGISDIIILKGMCREAKNRLLTRIAFLLNEKGRNLDGIMNPFEAGSYEGLIVRENGIAIIDEACSGRITGEEINLDAYLTGQLEISTEEEELLKEKRKWAYENLCRSYYEAKLIHDDWENVYIKNMDISRLNSYTDKIISDLISYRKGSLEGQRRTGFFGASTADGSVNYIEGLTNDLKTRYYIKGRPGTGKSTFLKKFASVAEKNGFNTEVYYCSFDKNSLDMVIVRELSLAIFDSTPPHEVYPSRGGDGILDFYAESGLFGIDEKYCDELDFISKKYANKIKQGISYLRLGNCFDAELEFYYRRILNEDGICIQADKILRRIL